MKTIQEYRSYLIVIAIAILLRVFVFRISVVSGQSMEDTFRNRNILFCTIFDRTDLKHGDIIVFKSPVEDKLYVKRVIGLPKDEIEIDYEHIILNGKILEEPYIKEKTSYYKNSIKLENEYFVLGDNRNNSSDSRHFGPIPPDSIVAKVRFKIF
ncbi:MAG: signal peptidase I [Peptoniphilus sp.]|uniref:signal peptidase I n=1 Tax=Peptoniphilus sp. TaxID=1971214 RepID=UPI002A75EF7E|nr:signal peptidase I [Peptoniphilus sp.]MDY2986727.1 signal peptidase I [Peptoniphilus sp.]